jgi:hypothetical protein
MELAILTALAIVGLIIVPSVFMVRSLLADTRGHQKAAARTGESRPHTSAAEMGYRDGK